MTPLATKFDWNSSNGQTNPAWNWPGLPCHLLPTDLLSWYNTARPSLSWASPELMQESRWCLEWGRYATLQGCSGDTGGVSRELGVAEFCPSWIEFAELHRSLKFIPYSTTETNQGKTKRAPKGKGMRLIQQLAHTGSEDHAAELNQPTCFTSDVPQPSKRKAGEEQWAGHHTVGSSRLWAV